MIKESFLSKVAINIAETYNRDFSNLNIIFTNKRAKTFFNEALYNHLQKPFFSPKYYTINDFINQYSDLVQGEELVLVYNLYNVYSEIYYRDKENIEQESFEQFYYWGIMLLKDFDDIDKNLACAENIFKTIEDYKELDNKFDFLTQEQKELLNGFFEGCFKDKPSEIKSHFVSVWNCLLEIYNKYKERLVELGIGYSGMIYRELVESLKTENNIQTQQNFCVIGFNVLNKVEKEIFSWLKQTYDTRFYWDYDDYYLNNLKQEAGLFMRENLNNFPSPKDFEINTNLISNNNTKLEIISSPNENGQVGYIDEWLEELVKTNENLEQKDIAIILCNEDLLPSVLSALPERIGEKKTKVNITMGYKFQSTPMYGLIDAYLNYQSSLIKNPTARLKNLLPFVEHNYFAGSYKDIIHNLKRNMVISLSGDDIKSFVEISDLLKQKTTPKEILSSLQEILYIVAKTNINKETKGHNGIEEVISETMYRLSTSINNLKDLFENEEIKITGKLLYQTIRSALTSIMIPFEGDPIDGIQIMGLLESRSLDFKHILFLSTNDDLLPNVGMDSSFIPFTIRKAYNLTTIERKIAVFAYYFYRLFHHAESMHFLYNSTTTDVKPKEMSRFLQQLRIESNKKFTYSTFISSINSPEEKIIEVKKYKTYIDKIINKAEQEYISPTYLNDYLNCELKFYFKRVLGLATVDEFEEELQDNVFGEIFHKSAKDFYNGIKEEKKTSIITKSDIEKQEINVYNIVKKNFEEEYLNKKNRNKGKIEYNQIQKIKLEILTKYLHKLLEIDKAYTPFTMLAMEVNIKKPITINGHNIIIGGTIDRLDYKVNENGEGILRIIDYKTNNTPKGNVSFNQIFDINNINDPAKRNDYILQAFLYSWLITDNKEDKECNKLLSEINIDKIKPEILYIKKATSNDYVGDIILNDSEKGSNILVDNYSIFNSDFELELKTCLEEMLSYKEDEFCSQRKNDCDYCDYRSICF
ncbi:MAG: PD-(D/E)XK nuclease family protein [Bacteroidales bacterium]|jgi:hypothetical protein